MPWKKRVTVALTGQSFGLFVVVCAFAGYANGEYAKDEINRKRGHERLNVFKALKLVPALVPASTLRDPSARSRKRDQAEFVCKGLLSQSEIHWWALDSVKTSELALHGVATTAPGVNKTSLVLNGESLLRVKDSSGLAAKKVGFTLTAWVNPYRLGGNQQMIAAKNRYSLNERQWGVMIDKDNRFRLYAWQGKWVTAEAKTTIQPGHWYHVGVVVRPSSAELWVNGKLADQVQLTQSIPQTKAPLTFGGVDDNGRIRQNFVGALDEIRLFNKPLDAKQMATAYKPVTATHKIPVPPQKFTLWNGPALPKMSEAEVLKGVQFHIIKKFEQKVDGYGFLHGVALAWHKGKLYASFGHNKGSENTLTEEGRYCVSEDGGKTWSKVQTIDVGIEDDDLAVSHGVFISQGEVLWAFLGSFYGTRERVHTRAYTMNEKTEKWQPLGTVVKDGFWPMTEPLKMDDGNWIMPGFIVGQGHPAAVAISVGDDLKKWKTAVIPRGTGLGNVWGESSIIVDGPRVTNIARYGGKALALAAISNDYGRTWTASAESNLPMATSKPASGMLSTGQRYLVCSTTADGGGRRSPLTIAVSKPGEDTFSKVLVIRHAVFSKGPGESHPGAALSYPYAIEYQGKLYVGYSNNGERNGNNNSAELAVIPIEKLRVK